MDYVGKKEAASILGRNERSINNYASEGRLKKFYRQGKSGQEAVFLRGDVERLKAELSGGPIVPVTPVTPRSRSLPAPTLATDSNLPLQSLSMLPAKERPLLVTEMRAKMTLTLREASIVGGLSQKTIKEAIERERLPSIKDGRRILVRPEDLHDFIASLAEG